MKVKMILLNLLLICFLISFSACNQSENKTKTQALPSHPRILMLEGEETAIKQTIASDPVWEKTHQFILGECNKLIG